MSETDAHIIAATPDEEYEQEVFDEDADANADDVDVATGYDDESFDEEADADDDVDEHLVVGESHATMDEQDASLYVSEIKQLPSSFTSGSSKPSHSSSASPGRSLTGASSLPSLPSIFGPASNSGLTALGRAHFFGGVRNEGEQQTAATATSMSHARRTAHSTAQPSRPSQLVTSVYHLEAYNTSNLLEQSVPLGIHALTLPSQSYSAANPTSASCDSVELDGGKLILSVGRDQTAGIGFGSGFGLGGTNGAALARNALHAATHASNNHGIFLRATLQDAEDDDHEPGNEKHAATASNGSHDSLQLWVQPEPKYNGQRKQDSPADRAYASLFGEDDTELAATDSVENTAGEPQTLPSCYAPKRLGPYVFRVLSLYTSMPQQAEDIDQFRMRTLGGAANEKDGARASEEEAKENEQKVGGVAPPGGAEVDVPANHALSSLPTPSRSGIDAEPVTTLFVIVEKRVQMKAAQPSKAAAASTSFNPPLSSTASSPSFIPPRSRLDGWTLPPLPEGSRHTFWISTHQLFPTAEYASADLEALRPNGASVCLAPSSSSSSTSSASSPQPQQQQQHGSTGAGGNLDAYDDLLELRLEIQPIHDAALNQFDLSIIEKRIEKERRRDEEKRVRKNKKKTTRVQDAAALDHENKTNSDANKVDKKRRKKRRPKRSKPPSSPTLVSLSIHPATDCDINAAGTDPSPNTSPDVVRIKIDLCPTAVTVAAPSSDSLPDSTVANVAVASAAPSLSDLLATISSSYSSSKQNTGKPFQLPTSISHITQGMSTKELVELTEKFLKDREERSPSRVQSQEREDSHQHRPSSTSDPSSPIALQHSNLSTRCTWPFTVRFTATRMELTSGMDVERSVEADQLQTRHNVPLPRTTAAASSTTHDKQGGGNSGGDGEKNAGPIQIRLGDHDLRILRTVGLLCDWCPPKKIAGENGAENDETSTRQPFDQPILVSQQPLLSFHAQVEVSRRAASMDNL